MRANKHLNQMYQPVDPIKAKVPNADDPDVYEWQ